RIRTACSTLTALEKVRRSILADVRVFDQPRRIDVGRLIAHTVASFIHQRRRQCRREVRGQYLRSPQRIAEETAWPAWKVVVVGISLKSPSDADAVTRIEIVIDPEI